MNFTRREFLATSAALVAGCSKSPRVFPGSIVGGGSKFGHRLREGGFPAPTETEGTQVAIIGGGIAGLAAARRLRKQGIRDIVLLELENEAGGNAASGRNAITAYPWGAHYLPLPNDESHEVRELLQDLGLITGRNAEGVPIYEEEALCADPMERLFDYGRWHEGLVPQLGLANEDRKQYRRFSEQIETLRHTRDGDGRHAFAIPLDRSSREFFHLDLMTMEAWLDREGYTSAPLHWYVDYACRDDYGAGAAQVSAWAGLHYFAARRGKAANADHDAVLTWPEGNGWLVKQIGEPIREAVRGGSLVFSVDPEQGTVDYFSAAEGRTRRLRAQAVICCAPRFVAQRLVRGLSPAPPMEYSPWMVANLTLDAVPGGYGVPVAWDNVFRNSRSLGYVVATHQNLPGPRGGTVLTHYWPLDERAPRVERERALSRTHADWCAEIVADLERAHPEIAPRIQQIDVWLWGHGMIRPVPGYISSEARAALAAPLGRVHFAHSDLSGISIFEEAYTRGVQAADAARSTLS